MTPREVDTKLAEIWEAEQKLRYYLRSEKERLERTKLTPTGSYRMHRITESEERIASYEAQIAKLRAEAAPLEAEYDARLWKRYFLVTNSNGHVHRGMDCTTCYATTTYGWLPELSGCDEAEMVEEFGEKACTICFPDAPALKAFHGPGRRDAAAKAEREAEKAQKAAEKAAKAITAPDGGPLRVPGGYGEIRTKVAAQRELSSAVQSFMWYGPSHPSDFLTQVRYLRDALEAAGIDATPIIERAVKKGKKEGSKYELILKEA